MLTTVVLAAASIATCCVWSGGTASAQRADGGLDITSTYTYTVDPALNVVHVVAELSSINTVPDQISGNDIDKTYFTGFSVPLPAEAVGMAASQEGAPITFSLRDIDTTTSYFVIDLEFAAHLFYNRTATVLLTYDIAGQPPRSAGVTRINGAYTAFEAFGLADPGSLTVRVVVPAGYVIDTLGSDAVQTVEDGNTVYTATGIEQPDEFTLFISARNDDALTSQAHTVGVNDFVVRSWPDDAEWRAFIGDHLDRGVPALEQLIGVPWPEDQPIEITEAVTPYLYGYGGWYNSSSKRLEVGENLEPQTVVHELSHAWFGNAWFAERWISEGLAQEYAGLANEQLGEPAVEPEAIVDTAPGAAPLTTWSDDADDQAADEGEDYGYNAAWFVIDGIVDEVGVDAMQAVFAAAAADEISYLGDLPPETFGLDGTWRRFLDLMQNRTDSVAALELMTRYVMTPEQAALLDDRAAARTAYESIEADGGLWAPPVGVRRSMTNWHFDDATQMMTQSAVALERRDALVTTLDDLGVALDPAVEVAYEAETTDLEVTTDLLDSAAADADRVVAHRAAMLAGLDELGIEPTDAFDDEYTTGTLTLATITDELDQRVDATTAVAAAIESVDDDRSIAQRIGLYGADPDEMAAAATAALADGDTELAQAEAADATELIAESAEVGTRRLTTAAIAVAVVVLLLVALIVVRRRRRRGRPDGEAADPADALPDERPADPPVDDHSVSLCLGTKFNSAFSTSSPKAGWM
jgi:hypothetical protein